MRGTKSKVKIYNKLTIEKMRYYDKEKIKTM